MLKHVFVCVPDVHQQKMREKKESTKAYNCGALKIHNGKMLAIFAGEHNEPFNFYQDLMI